MSGNEVILGDLAAQQPPVGEHNTDVPELNPASIYQSVKQEISRMDNDEILQGEVTFLEKPLGEIVDDDRAGWTGSISVANRIKSGEITREDVEHAKRRVNDFYIATTPGSIVRCIDGRTSAGFNPADVLAKVKGFVSNVKSRLIRKESPAFENLGPQIPGGTLAGGVSYRHATSSSFKDFRNAKIKDDARVFGERSAAGKTGYAPGDHQAHPEKPGLGCGAVDGIEDTHGKVNPNNLVTLYELSKSVLGSGFRESHFSHFISSANSLASNDEYFASKQDAIDYLAATNPNALPELIGGHAEIAVMINTVKDTTLHRDYYNAVMKEETGKDLQIFGYDLWYTQEMAEKLFSESSELQERYVHCRLAMSLAALMYLTDGTIDVGVRNPTQADFVKAA